jgi:hypothetical protein
MLKETIPEFFETDREMLKELLPFMPAKHKNWLNTYVKSIDIKFSENFFDKIPYVKKDQ